MRIQPVISPGRIKLYGCSGNGPPFCTQNQRFSNDDNREYFKLHYDAVVSLHFIIPISKLRNCSPKHTFRKMCTKSSLSLQVHLLANGHRDWVSLAVYYLYTAVSIYVLYIFPVDFATEYLPTTGVLEHHLWPKIMTKIIQVYTSFISYNGTNVMPGCYNYQKLSLKR